MHFRKASKNDLPFIVECILESEKSGGEVIGYLNIFKISLSEFERLLLDIFNEEIEGQAWHLNHWYVIADDNDVAVAGLSSWIEGEDGISSDIKKSQILHFFLSEKWTSAESTLNEISKVSIPRKFNYLQLEHLYSLPEHRGKGNMKKLIEEVLNLNPNIQAEIQLLENNENAVSLYRYMGFSVSERKCNEALERLSLLSGSCKIQMLK